MNFFQKVGISTPNKKFISFAEQSWNGRHGRLLLLRTTQIDVLIRGLFCFYLFVKYFFVCDKFDLFDFWFLIVNLVIFFSRHCPLHRPTSSSIFIMKYFRPKSTSKKKKCWDELLIYYLICKNSWSAIPRRNNIECKKK